MYYGVAVVTTVNLAEVAESDTFGDVTAGGSVSGHGGGGSTSGDGGERGRGNGGGVGIGGGSVGAKGQFN